MTVKSTDVHSVWPAMHTPSLWSGGHFRLTPLQLPTWNKVPKLLAAGTHAVTGREWRAHRAAGERRSNESEALRT